MNKQNELKEHGDVLRKLKEDKADKEAIKEAVTKLGKLKEELTLLTEIPRKVGGLPQTVDNTIDYSKDFFGCPAYLTVSGQLQVETFCSALSNVYTFGPTFRAEESHTSRHLAEFWMIEPEIAFADLEDDMRLAEDYVRYCCQFVLDHNREDLRTIDTYHKYAAEQAAKQAKKGQQARVADQPAEQRLEQVASSDFQKISYTEAIEVLIKSGHKFENKVEWGIDLASEHERYLAEIIYKRPTIVYNYPKGIKAFYMRANDDGKTVAAMDVLCPQIGELIGGSQREERLDVLINRIAEMHLKEEDFKWYLELRRFGTNPHAGFGLGFERLLLFATGMENIRDVIPFARAPGTPVF